MKIEADQFLNLKNFEQNTTRPFFDRVRAWGRIDVKGIPANCCREPAPLKGNDYRKEKKRRSKAKKGRSEAKKGSSKAKKVSSKVRKEERKKERNE